jgi:hypothetical protein
VDLQSALSRTTYGRQPEIEAVGSPTRTPTQEAWIIGGDSPTLSLGSAGHK